MEKLIFFFFFFFFKKSFSDLVMPVPCIECVTFGALKEALDEPLVCQNTYHDIKYGGAYVH